MNNAPNDAPLLVHVLQQLFKAFPENGITDQHKLERLKLYVSELADLDPRAVALAVKKLIDTNIFFPRVAEIRTAVHDLSQPASESALDAWSNWESGRGNEIARDILRRMSIDHWAVRHMGTYELGRALGEFTREYNRRIESARQRALLPPVVREQIERIESAESQQSAIADRRPTESTRQEVTDRSKNSTWEDIYSWENLPQELKDTIHSPSDIRAFLELLLGERKRKEAEAQAQREATQRDRLRQQAAYLLKRESTR